jgi:TPR repeat protein
MKYGGIGTSKDLQSAVQDHRKAAELGQIEAMYHLGVAFADGNAVPKDHASALHWLNKSIAHEDRYGNNPVRSQAQRALGALYENGYGVGNDLLIAYAFYNLAASDGDQKANEDLSRVAKLLKPDELKEAQALSQSWKPGTPLSRRTRSAAS